MASTKENLQINSRKSSFTESMSSRSSSFINVEDDNISMVSSQCEMNQSLSSDSLEVSAFQNSLPVLKGNSENTDDLSDTETIINSDNEEYNPQNSRGNLCEQLYNNLQDLFKKQNPMTGFFDVVFLIDSKKIYVHQLILRLRGATKLIKFIKRNGSDKKIRKVDMNIGGDNPITFEELFIFTKSLYFNNVGSDLTPSNVMSILSLANLFDIRSLIINCHIYLTGPKWEDDALTLLEKANNFSDDEIALRCLKVIAKKTEMYLSSPKFLEIKHATLVQLLQKRIFNIDAKKLFDKVYEWATTNACDNNDHLDGSVIQEVLGEAINLIPFENMHSKEFLVVCETGIFNDKQKFNILKSILEKNDSPGSSESNKSCNPVSATNKTPKSQTAAHSKILPVVYDSHSDLNDKINENITKSENVMHAEKPFKTIGKNSKTVLNLFSDARDEQIEILKSTIDKIEKGVIQCYNDSADKTSENGIDIPKVKVNDEPNCLKPVASLNPSFRSGSSILLFPSRSRTRTYTPSSCPRKERNERLRF